ncbi:MAG: chitobiase/beta-hexosaminidase C-terminal domain-containing protein [Planctomycetota bacterium]
MAAVAIGGMCCIEDGVVYVRKDDYCLALDLETGRPLAKHTAPPRPHGRKGEWGYLAVERGILFGTLSNEQHVVRGQHGKGNERVQVPMERHFTESILLFAMDARTGEVKWSYTAQDSIRNNSIAVGNGRVHFIDRPVAEIDRILKYIVHEKRRGREPLPVPPKGILICRDAETGRELWRDRDDVFGTTLALSKRHDLLVMCYNRVGRTIPSDTFARDARCYRASTGERVWQIDDLGNRPVLSDRIIYSHPNAYDLFTGKRRPLARDADPTDRTRPWSVKGKGCGCGTPLGSKWMLFTRSGALGYYDIDCDLGWMETYGGMRSGCWLNSLPVGGIVLVPDDTRACRCSYQNQASIALIERGVRAPEVLPEAGQQNYAYTNRHTRTEVEFTGSLVVTIGRPAHGIEVRYTLDGSYPTAGSTPYARPITLSETTTVRASAFKAGRKVAVRDGVLFVKVEKLVPPGRAGAGRERRTKKR